MQPAFLQKIEDPLFARKKVELYLKREDLLHPVISGNKWRKLKYNLSAAKEQEKNILLTFGGAYSNHIAAVAAAGKEFNFKTLGFIRGEEHLPLNATLTLAANCGMQLFYLDREIYRQKNKPEFIAALQQQYPEAYILPEGGTNLLAVKGCTEIVNDIDIPFDYICCAAGTGGTLAGIIAGMQGEKKVIGFPSLKGGEFLYPEIQELVKAYTGLEYTNWELQTQYHFGGYAKVKPELMAFIKDFKAQQGILLEPIYTGKMLFGIYDLIQQDYFKPSSTIVVIHTGGLQGIAGFEERLGIRL
ncbi:MAG: 1-aminocyclopropane-1-carboxylate deaminase [Cytophagales bacterium CG18_big_fil_WC_8_21_14_2_50_42_9]|nr:MAG: 1-aminocyclopropane-1-carboxylate deaminase [Cytophagales bacterium CG18_big_fil_WC_8_21_14_2_50_42_9]